jgi:Concanavalin A-like lectin/glucanases superfamily
MNRRIVLNLGSIILLWAAPALAAPMLPVTLPGMTNEYRLDDGSGTTTVDSVGGDNATLQSFGAGNSEWIDGEFGSAVKYVNQNAYIITNSPIALSAANQFSVSFWSRLDSLPNFNDQVLVTPQQDNWVTMTPNGDSIGKTGIGIRTVRDVNGPIYGVWENYVVTFDRTSGTAKVYRDGALRDTGTVSLPSLNTQWVFGHNQDPGNTNGSWAGALDEIQFYNRVLTPSDAAALASRPPQPGIAAHLVVPAHSYGSQPVGQYATATTTFFVDPSKTDWIAWNRFRDLRAVSDSKPGQLLLGTYTPEVDDYFNLTVTNPLGQSMTLAMDQNDAVGAPFGLQSVIYGAAATTPIVARGNNLGTPYLFDESGGFNSIFTTAGNYRFDFSFQNIGGLAGYPDVYLLAHSVPEPSSVVVAVGAIVGFTVGLARRRSRGYATTRTRRLA